LARLPARKEEGRRTEEEKEVEGIGVIAASIVMAGKIYGVNGLLLKQTKIWGIDFNAWTCLGEVYSRYNSNWDFYVLRW
jgi:hypothetical protein